MDDKIQFGNQNRIIYIAPSLLKRAYLTQNPRFKVYKMDAYNLQIIKTVITAAPFLIGRFLILKTIKRIAENFNFGIERVRVIYRIVNILFILVAIIIIAGIWGVQRQEFLFFITSTVTVLGIAFFAQWSILSNITSGLVLFFNHPLKIGDQIQIIEKDFTIEGKLTDISIFFMHIETKEGNKITIPNSLALQKTIQVTHDGSNPQLHEERYII